MAKYKVKTPTSINQSAYPALPVLPPGRLIRVAVADWSEEENLLASALVTACLESRAVVHIPLERASGLLANLVSVGRVPQILAARHRLSTGGYVDILLCSRTIGSLELITPLPSLFKVALREGNFQIQLPIDGQATEPISPGIRALNRRRGLLSFRPPWSRCP